MIDFSKSNFQTHAAVYYWWNDNPEVKPYQDLKCPVIPSIAVLRAHNPKLPIYVLDVSHCQRSLDEWGDFPRRLDFKVLAWKPKILSAEYSGLLTRTGRLKEKRYQMFCSRVWDIHEFCNSRMGTEPHNIIYMDSDVFWLKNPCPLIPEMYSRLDKFYCGSNAGVFYFDRRSINTQVVFNLWKSTIMLALIDDDFFKELKFWFEQAREFPFHDEIVFAYLERHYASHIAPVPQEENLLIDDVLRWPQNMLKFARSIHALSEVCGPKRGRICLCLQELKDAITSVLMEEEIYQIYGDATPEKVISIHDLSSSSNEDLIKMLRFMGKDEAWVPEKITDRFPPKIKLNDLTVGRSVI